MAAPRLDAMPMEVLHEICDELHASHPSSVAQLALVSRQCRRAATFALFRRITLTVESPEKLAADVQQLTSILLLNNTFRHVRALAVQGNVWRAWRRDAHKQEPDSAGKRSPPFAYEDAWLPLAHLMEKLSALKDIYFGCESSFPSCVLSVLHSSKLSACRLHIRRLRLGGLLRGTTQADSGPLELGPTELALITSPNLYAIKLSGSRYSSSGKADYHLEAILDVVASGSSSICELEQSYRRPKDTPALRRLDRAGARGPYPGLVLPDRLNKNLSAQANLTSLSLTAGWDFVKVCQQRTTFSALRILRLGHVDARTLKWIAEHAEFSSLSVLAIETEPSDNASATATLLQSLPSLNELSIFGEVNGLTLSAIVDHHGRSLRRLSIPEGTSSLENLQMLNEACPFLEHCGVRISRTQGDEHEVRLYTCLGTFAKMRTIHLTLDCSILVVNGYAPHGPDGSIIGLDCTNKGLCIRRVLVNCAVDAALATAIFRRITAAKSKASARLQSIEVNVVRAGTVCASGADFLTGMAVCYCSRCRLPKLEHVYRHFERQWSCTPNPRDDKPHEVVTEELQSSQAKRKRFEEALDYRPPELLVLEPGFCALWPRETSQDWRQVWSSFPLVET